MIITRRMPPPACERLGQCFDLPFKHLCWTPQRILLGFASFSGGMLEKIWDNHGTSSPETMVFPCLLPMETMVVFCQFSLNQAIVWVSPSSMLLHNQHHHQHHHHHHRQGHPKNGKMSTCRGSSQWIWWYSGHVNVHGKHTKNHGKSPCYWWVNQLFLWPFSIAVC